MENRKEIKLFFIRYINDELSSEEQGRVAYYLGTKEGKKCMEEVMDEVSEKVSEEREKIDSKISNSIYRKLEESIGSKAQRSIKQPGTAHYFPNILKIAAVFIGLLLFSGIIYKVYDDFQKTTYTTVSGQQKKIVLPDLSTVTLNGSSSLTYYKDWESSDKREVQLIGEAFFDVQKNVMKPFVVHTSEIKIKVLGTSFNVKSYEEDDIIETILVEGKVAIENPINRNFPEKDIILTPNQKAIFSKVSEKIVLTEVEADVQTAWKTGKLIFEDEPFEEIIKDLERWYGVKIILSEEVSRACRFRVKIENESIEEVLDLFQSTTDLTYTIEGKKIIVKGNLCQKPN